MKLLEHFDAELEVSALSYAARLLFADLERDSMIERALDSLADLGHSRHVGLFVLDRRRGELVCQGVLRDAKPRVSHLREPMEGSPLQEVVRGKRPMVFGLRERHGLPWPTVAGGLPGRECFCAPLVGADMQVNGLVTLDHPQGMEFAAAEAQPLITYLTLLALALEAARLFRLAVTDGLTGLYVRRYFDIRLKEELGRLNRFGGGLAILVMDLDQFKEVNDGQGHAFGDEVLKMAAAAVRKAARRKIDVACRYGGDELVLILPGDDAQGARAVGEKIRQELAGHEFAGRQGPVRVTVSGGAAAVQGPTSLSSDELFQRADQALYRAKQGGRNRVEVHGE